MRHPRRLSWCGALFLLALPGTPFSPSTTVAVGQPPPSIIEVSPSSGGPGTVVQVRGVTGGVRVALFLAVSLAPQAMNGSCPFDLNGPIVSIGGTEGDGAAGTFTATATIPATWRSGRPITETDLCIVAGEEGHFTDSRPFTFKPSALPTAGNESGTVWWTVVLLAVSCIAVGRLALKKATDSPRK